MPRNKNPEQTVQRILDTASDLFIKKGYDKTSVQDILDKLNMSKGGIYHHFRSKEEMLQAIIARSEAQTYEFLQGFMDADKGETGKARLEALLKAVADNTLKNADSRFLKMQFQNTLFFMKGMQSNMKNDARSIADIIRRGNEDGSLCAGDPEMVAEILLMLFNVWTNPVVFSRGYEATERRLKYLQETMKSMGADVFSDELIITYLDIYSRSGMFESGDEN